MDYNYFVMRNNVQEGPYSQKEILEMALPANTLVWREGMSDWKKIFQVPELKPGITPPVFNQEEKLSAWDYYLKCLKNYANFNGRARRKEYWSFFLFNFLVSFVLQLLMIFAEFEYLDGLYILAYILLLIFGLGVILPGIAVTVRRLHDIGKGGEWIFLGLVPIVGGIVLFIWFLKEGEPTQNRFGDKTK